jgi:hypothetical protein
LILLDAIIVGVAGAMTWAGSQLRLNLLAVGIFVVCAIVLVVAVALSWRFVAAQIEQSNRDAASRVENARIEKQRRVAAQARAASQLLQNDLRGIVVSDCYYNSDTRALQWRITSQLPRPVHDVALKLSVIGDQKTVVDVEHLIISDVLIPEETKSFSYGVEIPGLYTQPGLPGVWLYHVQAEVTDAYYED